MKEHQKEYVREAVEKVVPKEEVEEVVYELMQKRTMTCPYRDDILKTKSEVKRMGRDEIPTIKRMLWGVMIMLFTVLITALLTLTLTANNDTAISKFIVAMLNGGG